MLVANWSSSPNHGPPTGGRLTGVEAGDDPNILLTPPATASSRVYERRNQFAIFTGETKALRVRWRHVVVDSHATFAAAGLRGDETLAPSLRARGHDDD
jgi:hypothetical protein